MHPAFTSLQDAATYIPTTLGANLEGYSKAYKEMNVLDFRAKNDLPCTVLVTKELSVQQLQFLRQLVKLRYRMHLTLDKLPILTTMRSKGKELNFAIKGMPIGFKFPSYAYRGRPKKDGEDIFLYNHWRFTVTYHEDPELFQGVRITGFDIHPVSIAHASPPSSESGDQTTIQTCSDGYRLENNRDTCLFVKDFGNTPQTVTFSYQVEWVERKKLTWDDRWDVYFLGLPDEAIHYFSMLHAVVCMVILAAFVATALIRVFRKDLAGGTKKDNGWKHLRGDVFRQPESPMLLSVLVGNGLHILVAPS
mmetsp:Transcript_33369/g.80719  ORF Transcript_33369/g.80719 Transcript_33369/m.80719 type:complete len:306 (-) Transcript_33369:1075-1992(-)